MWKCIYTVVPNCPVANCSLSIFSEPKCSIENGGDAFPLRVFTPWDSASEKDINYVLTHRRSWSVSWGQSQSGKDSPQHSRSALSRGNTWKFPFDGIQFGGSTGTSSLAWEDKPSSGRRWSTPSDHTPTGTSSFLAEKKFHTQGENLLQGHREIPGKLSIALLCNARAVFTVYYKGDQINPYLLAEYLPLQF